MAKNRGMNPGGRGNRTPHRLRLVQGTERKSAGPPPTAGGGIGACPRGEPLAVRRAWRTMCREVGWLSQSSDRRALLLLARTLADLDTARAFGMTPASAAGLATGRESGRRFDPTDPLGLG